MKRYLLVFALLIKVLNAQGQNQKQQAKLEKEHGFGDIILGTSKSKYSDLKFKPDPQIDRSIDKCLETFNRMGEDFQFGPYKASNVYYTYMHDKLENVLIEFKSEGSNAYILKELTKLYGKSKPLGEYGTVYYRFWEADTFIIMVDLYQPNVILRLKQEYKDHDCK